jgi:hypothetical protein
LLGREYPPGGIEEVIPSELPAMAKAVKGARSREVGCQKQERLYELEEEPARPNTLLKVNEA